LELKTKYIRQIIIIFKCPKNDQQIYKYSHNFINNRQNTHSLYGDVINVTGDIYFKLLDVGIYKKACTMLMLKSRIFWVSKLCSSEKVRNFGGTYRLHLLGQELRQARKEQEQPLLVACFWLDSCLASSSPEEVFSSETLNVSQLHGVRVQNTVNFMVTAECIPNPTQS
jgi:hypothetical protein